MGIEPLIYNWKLECRSQATTEDSHTRNHSLTRLEFSADLLLCVYRISTLAKLLLRSPNPLKTIIFLWSRAALQVTVLLTNFTLKDLQQVFQIFRIRDFILGFETKSILAFSKFINFWFWICRVLVGLLIFGVLGLIIEKYSQVVTRAKMNFNTFSNKDDRSTDLSIQNSRRGRRDDFLERRNSPKLQ